MFPLTPPPSIERTNKNQAAAPTAAPSAIWRASDLRRRRVASASETRGVASRSRRAGVGVIMLYGYSVGSSARELVERSGPEPVAANFSVKARQVDLRWPSAIKPSLGCCRQEPQALVILGAAPWRSHEPTWVCSNESARLPTSSPRRSRSAERGRHRQASTS